MGIALGFCMRELLLLGVAARARRPLHRRVQRNAAEEELFERIREEGLAVVAADAEMNPHDLLIQLLRRALD